MTKVRKKIGTIPINDIEQQVQQSTQAAVTQMQQDVTDFINEQTAQYPEIGGTFKYIEDPEKRSEVVTDSEGKILSYRDSEGMMHEEVGIESAVVNTNSLNLTAEGMTEFQQALKDAGFQPGGSGDWSDYISNDGESPLSLEIPRLASINLLTDFDLTQLNKEYNTGAVVGINCDIPIYAEFFDMQGNYFKKKVFISGQGRSTMNRPKKNIAIDFFDSEWDGDAFSVRFGNWVPQDSFHLKAYVNETFNGNGAWAYKIYEEMEKSWGVEYDHVWKRALLDMSQNTSTKAYGTEPADNSKFEDTGARCYPDGFPCIVYQNGQFWGVFAWQIKKHRDNYKMKKSDAKHIHLDGVLGNDFWNVNGNVAWWTMEVRNPKDLVYDGPHNGTYKYDGDLAMAEIAGNSDGSMVYDSWVAGSYHQNKVVVHNGHYYINTIEGNTAEPIFDSKNNADTKPDFKNKTGCGWINCTNTIKVKNYVRSATMIMAKINAKEDAYIATPTAETLQALKDEFESYFNVNNLIDYIIINDIINNEDAFESNWQWTTYDGKRWWCNLYDCNVSFGYSGGQLTTQDFRAPLTTHCANSSNFMMRYIFTYYGQELNARYVYLRQNKIITAEKIMDIILSWINAVGCTNYAKEREKWVDDVSVDNIFRIKKWVYETIGNLDVLYGYNN